MFKDYYEVRAWLEDFIPYTYSKKNLGLERITYLLKLLGNPKEKFKSILVAGTSGKGSTAYYIAKLLQYSKSEIRNSKLETNPKYKNSNSQKVSSLEPMKIGLHLSPHLSYIGERMQIDGLPISRMRLIRLIGRIRSVVEKIKKESPKLTPSYFEILVAASFLYFAKEKVDWAVVEVGLGGRLDATNVLQSEVSVITNVGLDHTEILGKTIEKIAFEKAGIIKSNMRHATCDTRQFESVSVVTGATGKALKVIEEVAKAKNAMLINLNTLHVKNNSKSDMFRYISKPYYLFRYPSNSFASKNKNLALLTVLTLMSLRGSRSVNMNVRRSNLKILNPFDKTQDKQVQDDKSDDRRASLAMTVDNGVLKKAFSEPLAGRFEEIDDNVILDCAHNTDKVKYLIRAIKSYTNYSNNQSEVVLVVAFKKGKSWKKMIDLLVKSLPVKKIIATKFYAATDTGFFAAVAPSEIAKYAMSIVNSQSTIVKIVENSQEALFEALRFAQGKLSKLTFRDQNTTQLILVTGSLYLVGEVRTMWQLPEF